MKSVIPFCNNHNNNNRLVVIVVVILKKMHLTVANLLVGCKVSSNTLLCILLILHYQILQIHQSLYKLWEFINYHENNYSLPSFFSVDCRLIVVSENGKY